jgi:hypothetical protein
MDGSWRVRPAAERLRDGHRIRLLLVNEEWQAVGYQLGVVELLRTSEEPRVTGRLGPDLLGPDWDRDEAVRRLAAEPDRPIGEALLDQRNLAGIGNVYKAEVLFLRGLSPWQPTGSVPDLGALAELARRLLEVEQGAVRPHHHRQHAPRRGHWAPRPTGQAVPPVRYAGPFGRTGPGHLLVPVLPAAWLNPSSSHRSGGGARVLAAGQHEPDDQPGGCRRGAGLPGISCSTMRDSAAAMIARGGQVQRTAAADADGSWIRDRDRAAVRDAASGSNGTRGSGSV